MFTSGGESGGVDSARACLADLFLARAAFLTAVLGVSFVAAFFVGVVLAATFLAGIRCLSAAGLVSVFAASFLAGAAFVFPVGFTLALLPAAGPLFFAVAVPFCLAHRALCAAAIRSFASGLKVRLFRANSLRFRLVASFFDPLGRPRRLGWVEVPPVEAIRLAEPVGRGLEELSPTPSSRTRTLVRREISASIADRSSFVFMI